jgi:biotin synthase
VTIRLTEPFSRDDIIAMLTATAPEEIEAIRQAAEAVLLAHCGREVHYRGLVEFSNICRSDCLYCGIRRSRKDVERYELEVDQVVEAARWALEQGYGSMVIQSGERTDKPFIAAIIEAVRRIKEETCTPTNPEGLGITLCVGEQTPETYRRFFEAGAHRYLLRIETSNPELFAHIHPPQQTLASRVACLRSLREIGFQVGTGVMIGLPGQTVEHLADDVAFFVEHDIDMIGMGPFIPDPDTPMGNEPCPDPAERMRLALLMIAVTRLVMRDINIAATTALQTLDPLGREKGLQFGANVIMPQMTPMDVRRQYQLYPGKPCMDETAQTCGACLERRITSVGRVVGRGAWGDSHHALKRQGKKPTR